MPRQLNPQDRSTLRDLLLGTIEHCEISRHLVGTMAHTFYENGIKYGIPAFTFVGPAKVQGGHARIGLVAGKQAGDRLSAEVTLQLIERLLLQPQMANGLVLRIVPILNPVGLERPQSGASFHAETLERVHLQSPDGLIEINSGAGNALSFTLHAEATAQNALELASEDLQRLSSELDVRLDQRLLSVDALNPWVGGEPRRGWNLELTLPSSLSGAAATHLSSQFLLSFFRRLEELNPQASHPVLGAGPGAGYGFPRSRGAYRR